ncbi:MAG TPA: hypothetical protein VHE30_19635 [Polyangiaceae bacterium]|nr:hypothetical protein [Polyangiaceae bacterium]
MSTSGVVVRSQHAQHQRRSEPPLQPYQARLDVEMDDTAVSKVRDPSVSISLSAEGFVPERRPERTERLRGEAIRSVVLGTLLGALLVVLTVLVVRAFSN